MGRLICGCQISPGLSVGPEVVKAHKEHTLHALFFWDLLLRPGPIPEQRQAREKLMEVRIAYQEALDAAFPGV